MRQTKKTLEHNGKEYPLVFNLNVMEVIQDEYKTLDAWGELTDGSTGEVNVKALIFGFTAMINEGLEISNEENGTNEPLLTHKQAGRILTDIGLKEVTSAVNEIVVDSTQTDEDKDKAKNE